jgi:Putative zincin peptidase
MILPGFLITLLTFPGVVVHELAHQLFCRWTGTRVLRVCYFRLGNPAGYVVHERPTSVWKSILIGVGPLFVNTAAGLAIALVAIALHRSRHPNPWLFAALIWLAIAVAMHSFPSTGDARAIWSALWARGAPLTARLFGTPLVGLIYLGAFASIFWLDLAYGLGVAIGIPYLLHILPR